MERIGFALCIMSGIAAVSHLFIADRIAQVQALGVSLILFVAASLALLIDAAVNGD